MVRPPVAQPDRASDSESEGRAFESRRAGHDIIERVARAIFDVSPFRESAGHYEAQSEEYRRLCRVYARAAIAAMRPADEAMKAAGLLAFVQNVPKGAFLQAQEKGFTRGFGVGQVTHSSREIGTAFDAMIDAALSETAASPSPNPSNSDE